MAMRQSRIADLGRIITGSTPSSKEPHLFGSDVPFLTPSDMAFDRRIVQTNRGISAAGATRFKTRLLPAEAVAVVCIGATIGKTCMTEGAVLTNQQINSIVVDESQHSPSYVYYLMLAMTEQLKAVAGGAATPIINKSLFGSLEICVPDRMTQVRIGDHLRSFDDLIENARRRITILEDTARMLYREWFMHFRFPGHDHVESVDSDRGPLPEGWRWRNLFELAEIGFGYSFKSNRFAEAGPTRVVRIRDVPKNTTGTYTDEYPGERYEIHDGDTLIGMDGEFHMCRWADGLAHLNQRVARVRSKGRLSQLHLHLALEQPIQKLNRTIVGTTVAHLGKRHLEEIYIAEPSQPVLEVATEHLRPILELELNLRKQAQTLRAARDLLVPRLISGKLDVSELDLGLAEV